MKTFIRIFRIFIRIFRIFIRIFRIFIRIFRIFIRIFRIFIENIYNCQTIFRVFFGPKTHRPSKTTQIKELGLKDKTLSVVGLVPNSSIIWYLDLLGILIRSTTKREQAGCMHLGYFET